MQKTGDEAANTAKFTSSPGKVKTAARKIEEIQEQFSDIQKMKETMKVHRTASCKQILEIPASNKNFSRIQDYIDLAKNKYGIEIRFREE